MKLNGKMVIMCKRGKVRPVFDCAAPFKGVCIYSEVKQGPNLINDLVSALLRVRQYIYTIIADIEDMYLQVKSPAITAQCATFFVV